MMEETVDYWKHRAQEAEKTLAIQISLERQYKQRIDALMNPVCPKCKNGIKCPKCYLKG